MSESATIPVAPGAVPLLGHLPRLMRDPLKYFDTLAAHGGLLTLRLGRKRVLVVCDPVLTHRVLMEDEVFDKGGPLFDAARRLMPTAVGFVPHRRHRRLRRLMQPTFARGRLTGYGEIMTEQITAIVAGWPAGRELDVVAEMMAITGRVLAASMFSGSLSERTLRELVEDSIAMTRGLVREMALPAPLMRLPTPGNRRYRRAVTRLRRAMLELVAERRAEGAAGIEHGDLVSALLAGTADGGGDRLCDEEIVDQLVLFVIAGVDTTAQTVSWALHELSRHPGIEASLQAEVDEVLAGRPATYDDLPRFEVAARILSEVLRLHSPSWMFTRQTTEDTELGGHRIPAGTDMLYSPYIIGHRARTYRDPERFDPDRWLPERAAGVGREEYIPFGAGARKCIGDQFAFVEETLILATVAARWRLETVPGNRIRTSRTIVNTPHGLRLRAVARERSNLER